MAITLPNLWNSVHRPIIYTFAPEYTFVAAGNYLGNLQLIISPLSNVDNFIVGTNAIIPSGIYAGTHKVLSISGNALLLDTTYTAGAGGTVISTRVPVNLYAGYDAAHPGFTDYPYGLVASITAIRGADGNLIMIPNRLLTSQSLENMSERDYRRAKFNLTCDLKTKPSQIEKAIAQTKKQMEKFAKALDFMEAAKLRDEMFRLEAQLAGMKKK